MKRLIPFFGALLAGLVTVGATGIPIEFDRYQLILDRKPFGSETPPASAIVGGPGGAAAQVEPFVKFLKISAFVRDDFSPIIRVGLVETRTNQSYLLAEGESADGILLIRAEFEAERVLLSKDNLAYWLAMDGTYTLEAEPERKPEAAAAPPPQEESAEGPVVVTAPKPPKPRPKISGQRRVVPEPPKPDITPEPVLPPSAATSPRRTLTERRRMIEEIRKRRAELVQNREATPEESETETAPPAVAQTPSSDVPSPLEGSDLERQLQEYQMQAIREGREPLPIPLAPENDQQLVNEGILPPVSE